MSKGDVNIFAVKESAILNTLLSPLTDQNELSAVGSRPFGHKFDVTDN